MYHFFFQAEDDIRYYKVTGVQTCALPICIIFSFSSHFYCSHFYILTEKIRYLTSFYNQDAVSISIRYFEIGRASCRERVKFAVEVGYQIIKGDESKRKCEGMIKIR